MKIGHCRLCLTPKEQFYLIGRNENRFYPAKGVHDDIYANCLLFQIDQKELFLFQADFIEFEEEMVEDIKTMLMDRFGLDRDLILCSATHNHSSIVSYHKSWYTKKFDPQYRKWLMKQVCLCYESCEDNLQIATAKVGRDIIAGFYGSRIYPGELADNEVILLEFYDKNKKPFAGIINWAVHSNVISSDNQYLSGDLAGAVCTELEKTLGYYPAIIVGAAGDCTTEYQRKARDFAELSRISSKLAKAISDIKINQDISLENISVQTVIHTIYHHMEKVHEEARQALVTEKNPNKIKEYKALLKENLFYLNVKTWVIQLGDITIYAFPGELGSAFGKQLKQKTKHTALVFGYTNGYYGYFMPQETYGLSFVTDCTKIPCGESEIIIQKMLNTQL